MAEKLAWVNTNADALRRIIMCEPRGHAGMCGAVLVEGCRPDADAGVLFMDVDGYCGCSYDGAIAAAALAREYGLITSATADTWLFDTIVGPIRLAFRRGDSVRTGAALTLTGCPAFVLHGGIEVATGSRRVRADVAFGGAFYAIVDTESAGVPIDGTRNSELRRIALALTEAVAQTRTVTHPLLDHVTGLGGVIFTAPAQQEGADFRAVSVTAHGRVSRGPSGTGLAAVLSVLDAMGLPVGGQGITLEGLVGTRLRGRVVDRTSVGDYEAVIPAIDATAWATGTATWSLADTDPLPEGMVVE